MSNKAASSRQYNTDGNRTSTIRTAATKRRGDTTKLYLSLPKYIVFCFITSFATFKIMICNLNLRRYFVLRNS